MLVTVVVLALVTSLLKGGAALLPAVPPALARRLAGLAPALLAALVYVELADGRGVPQLGAKAAGVGAATVLAAVRAPFGLCVIAGAAVAAGVRASTGLS